MRRGDVWWASLPPPAGRRPVLLLSRDEAYVIRSQVTIAPVSTRIRNLVAEVRVGPEDGMPRQSAVNLDTIATIPRSSLESQITTLGSAKLRAVDAAIHFALGLRDEPPA